MSAGIYLHIPFCRSRCSYCDFATDVYRSNDAVERYVETLCREISFGAAGGNATVKERAVSEAAFRNNSGASHDGTLVHTRVSARNARVEVDTIYFGGGTPSLLSAKQVEKILEIINLNFEISDFKEITMEMNPATVTPETLKDYRSLGVSRASFGVQTFNDRALKLLARGHNADDARRTYSMLRDAGFDNISFDLIAGLPGQTLEDWELNLDEAIKMQPEHLSLYLLEIHEGTPLAEQVRGGRQPRPDDQLAAEMYEMMLDRLAAAGYEQYEISNFSRPGFESRHNTKYWTLDPVFGFGVSAHSFDGKQRYANSSDTAQYVESIETNGSAEVMREDIDLASEFNFLGLRMESGIDVHGFARRFGFDLLQKYRVELDRLIESNLVKVADNHLSLTQKGKLFSNEVFAVFV